MAKKAYKSFVPHSRPTLGEAEQQAIAEVLAAGQLACGARVKSFEQAFAGLLGMPEAVAVSSGTAGLHLALLTLGVGKGDEVLIPSYACSALLHAVQYVDATPVLVDSQAGHGHMDAKDAARKLSNKTKAAIPTHLFGDVVDPRPWQDLGIPLIEDSTQSLGGHWQGRPVGSLADVSVTSLYATKMITTGEGGMISTRDSLLASRLRDLRSYDEKTSRKTRYNYKMTEMAGAMGMVQLGRLASFVHTRREIAAGYRKASAAPGPANQTDSVFYRYLLRVEQDLPRALRAWQNEGIGAKRPVFLPLHRTLGMPDKDFPHAAAHHAQLLSLPLYPGLRAEEIGRVQQALAPKVHVEIP